MVPINIGNEPKTKPTQHSIRALHTAGLFPNIIICRSNKLIDHSICNKISISGMIPTDNILFLPDIDNVYNVPDYLLQQNILKLISNTLQLNSVIPKTIFLCDRINNLTSNCTSTVTIGIVGKYTGLHDSYISVIKALEAAALYRNKKLRIVWINSEHLEIINKNGISQQFNTAWKLMSMVDGLLCPGGFGDRAIEGKILAVNYARTHNIPFLGICLGMQVAVIEFARNIMYVKNANSIEFNRSTPFPIVIYEHNKNLCLGSRSTILRDGSLTYHLYGKRKEIYERHRHRYKINSTLINYLKFENYGMKITGRDKLNNEIDMIEIPQCKFFIGVQFHPEFLSKPLKPHPLFNGFIQSCIYE